jgi:fatty-acyl-CoA synthase
VMAQRLIGDIFRRAGRDAPDILAATHRGDGITFGEVDARSNQVARALEDLGVRHRDRVTWWGDTGLEVIPIFAACAKLGAAFAPVNALLSPEEAAAVVDYSKPRVVVVDDAHAERAMVFDHTVVTHQQLFAHADKQSVADVPSPAGMSEENTHVLFFTSGSTGQSKGVVISNRANYLRSDGGPTATDGGPGGVCMFPLFHMAGWTNALGAWQARKPIHFTTGDADEILRAVEQYRPTRLYCIPAVWERIFALDLSQYDVSCLQTADTGTSATPMSLIERIHEHFPWTTTSITYGSSECGPGTQLVWPDVLRKPGSVGLPMEGVELKLSETGEVYLRSEFLMDGYFDNPEATAAAIDDEGWYHTGELGHVDDEGYLSIIGRTKEVLRSGGEWVAPVEVELVLREHPAIREVAIVGIPDTRWGELVTAVVVCEPGLEDEVTVEALHAHCEGRLAPFKHPRRVERWDDLPRTPATGQIQRRQIVAALTS